MENKILIVEDDIVNMKILNSIITNHGFSPLNAKNGSEALKLLENNQIIGAILDLNLPDINGLEILKAIRNNSINKNAAILIVTENHDKLDTVIGLEIGADDYITKPFHHRELLARLNAALRRTKSAEKTGTNIIAYGDLEIDIDKRLVKKHNMTLNLSFKEFEILYLLASNPGRVISRETILDNVGGLDYSPGTRVVDMHISSIRKKLGDKDFYIDTVSGIGYRFRE